MHKKQFSLKEIAELTSSKLVGSPEKLIFHVADLESASSDDASFLSNSRYNQAMQASKAGVIFVDSTTILSPDKNFLIHENPSRAFQQLIELFFGVKQKLTGFDGIHATAVIHKTATIGNNVQIGPLVVIDENVSIGDNTSIHAGSVIGFGTSIGNDSMLYSHVTIRENCVIGNRVVIQPGAVIGSCGFGFTTDKKGHHTKLNQIGNVIIEDDVEIGANTTIDRSRFKSTKIGQGTKIDNLVQIAHGVVVGNHCIIVAQTGIAGSTEIGKHVVIAGQVAITGHIKICDGAVLSAKTGVTKSITKPGKYGGYPAMPLNDYNRNHIYVLRMEEFINKVKELNKRISELENQ